jgi:hypothetical protein
MRNDEFVRLLRRGQLPQIAAIDVAIAALDEVPADAEPASRAVVSDDGKVIRLILYAETGIVAFVEVDPIRAIAVAAELIGAALPRLTGE